jgi:hypothetical protein
MLRPLIRRVPRSRERGVTMPLVALSLVAILSFAALSIDLGSLYEAKAEAQRSADAAALAAVQIISSEGVTTDPTNGSGNWGLLCGGASSYASLAATNVANQNLIGGSPPTKVFVYYGTSAGTGTNKDCTATATGFGINPVVSVYVEQTSLPNFFSRIFSFINNGAASNSGVSATAYAEAFNPSDSNGGTVIPVQPRCVKPWMVPNLDPLHPSTCTSNCTNFVDPGTGSIKSPGTFGNGGVIGERFWLVPDCAGSAAPCALMFPLPPPLFPQPQANVPPSTDPNAPTTDANLEYLPGQAAFVPVAIPSDGSTACTTVADSANNYAPAIAGCDQTTVYRCGVQGANTVDLSENPVGGDVGGDTTNGVQCLIRESTASANQLYGQDALEPAGVGAVNGAAPPYYPFQIQLGTTNPLTGVSGVPSTISSSNNIVSLPIYDSTNQNQVWTSTTTVTVVGFLQVFINVVDGKGNVYVTVMNVSGCGNAVLGTQAPLTGTSPVPVRLIALPVPAS